MRLTDFDLYCELIKDKSGIVLSQDKSYMVESRLSPVAAEWGFPNLHAMTIELQGVPDPRLIDDIIEAITTNETAFFRDTRPFKTFQENVLPYLLETRIHGRGFKIWSAACSTGQEAASLALIIKEHHAKFSHWRIDILGTDISNNALDVAENGIYTQFEVQRGVPTKTLLTYFKQQGEKWKLIDQVRKMLKYQQFNLLDDMSGLGEFDVVFCCNVLKYFNEETKTDVLSRMALQMRDDAFLFLGEHENVMDIDDIFKQVPGLKGIYAKKGSVHLQSSGNTGMQSTA